MPRKTTFYRGVCIHFGEYAGVWWISSTLYRELDLTGYRQLEAAQRAIDAYLATY